MYWEVLKKGLIPVLSLTCTQKKVISKEEENAP